VNTYNSKTYKNEGFTLIEILVASVILFSSIAIVTVIQSGALRSSQKATTHIDISGATPHIMNKIKEQLREKGNLNEVEINGFGKMLRVQYKWHAQLLSFKGAVPSFEPDSGVYVEHTPKYKLWEVNVSSQVGKVEVNFSFKELSWNDK